MYGLGQAKRGGREEVLEERIEARKERVAERQLKKAMEAYPNLSPEEALRKFKSQQQTKGSIDELFREGWPIFLAVGAGLLVFTFLKK